ncbi:MAG: RHS repeat-associated core domain-containing protein [Chloroflexi bacterium]|nr:MAG: RHS repeat-associated core domain-containing protein [Chloroflexota bacterium]
MTGQPIAVRVSAIRQGNGTVQQTRYLPFGGYRAGSGPNEITSHAYTSQRENMEIGLYYYNARYYAPGLARFLSADTIVPNPTSPQSLNRYAYVLNSPVNFTDPTGHSECGVGQYICPDDHSASPPTPPTPPTPPMPTTTPTPAPTPTPTPDPVVQQILDSTVLLQIQYQGPTACPVGTAQFCIANSHGTVLDDQTILSHNHFQELSFSIHSITLYDAYGNVIPSNGGFTQQYLSNSQTSTLTFASGTFSSQTPATFGNVSTTGIQNGDRVAVIDWDGINPGSTHVVWANVTDISNHDGTQALKVDVTVNGGASGGGVFFNGTHIANNWTSGTETSFSWLTFTITSHPITWAAINQ